MYSSRFPVSLLRLLSNILLVYLLYALCRVVYVMEFWDIYAAGWHLLDFGSLLAGSLRFDTSAILYTNSLYILLVLLPLPRRLTFKAAWRTALKTLFVFVNALMLTLNLVDTVYSRYTGRRTTWSFFSEFSNEGNLGEIVGIELLNHWYLVLLGLAFLAALILLYRHPFPSPTPSRFQFSFFNFHFSLVNPLPRWQYILFSTLLVLLYIPLAVIGMRGGASTAVRPITRLSAPSPSATPTNTSTSLLKLP